MDRDWFTKHINMVSCLGSEIVIHFVLSSRLKLEGSASRKMIGLLSPSKGILRSDWILFTRTSGSISGRFFFHGFLLTPAEWELGNGSFMEDQRTRYCPPQYFLSATKHNQGNNFIFQEQRPPLYPATDYAFHLQQLAATSFTNYYLKKNGSHSSKLSRRSSDSNLNAAD